MHDAHDHMTSMIMTRTIINYYDAEKKDDVDDHGAENHEAEEYEQLNMISYSITRGTITNCIIIKSVKHHGTQSVIYVMQCSVRITLFHIYK